MEGSRVARSDAGQRAVFWEVRGGAETGGIIVRSGRQLSASQLPQRLSCGAVVRELEMDGSRLRYKLETGVGPDSGWVSIRISTAELLVKAEAPKVVGRFPASSPAGRPGVAACGVGAAQTRDMNCGPACVRYVATSACGSDPGARLCDESVGLLPGKCVLTRELALALGRLLPRAFAEVSMIFRFAVEADIDFYRKYKPHSELDHAAKMRRFYSEAVELGLGVESRQVEFYEIEDFLMGGEGDEHPHRLLIVLLDWNIITGMEIDGYFGHFCVVRHTSEEKVTLWNPDPDQHGELAVSAALFERARRAEGTDEDLVFVKWQSRNDQCEAEAYAAFGIDSSLFAEGRWLASMTYSGSTPQGGALNATISAAYRGDRKLMQLLLEDKVPLAPERNHGTTALIVAAWQGHLAVVSLLLNARGNINEGQPDGITALWCAAEGGWQRVAMLLLERAAAVDAANLDGQTPLWIAAKLGCAPLAAALLVKRAAVDMCAHNQSTPLCAAAFRGHPEVIHVLLDSSACAEHVNRNGATPLLIAAQAGRRGCVLVLLQHSADVQHRNARAATAMHLAAAAGHEGIVAALLEVRADIDTGNMYDATPLLLASEGGHILVVKTLLTLRADLQKRSRSGTTPLCQAIAKGYLSIAEVLQASSVDG
mmetsp:Transcript_104108/g.333826  ORF Transcript_104108/g.333826 Transcript_104108/m.333826 type:complete len:653 (-) Transcript_104108:432-2390(-)